MLAFNVCEHQSAGYTFQYVRRGSTPTALFEPRVPGCADVGALGHFLAPQSRRAPAGQLNAEGRRIEFRAAILKVGSKRIVVRGRHAHPVSRYTRVTSLLYPDRLCADSDLHSSLIWRIACVSSLLAQPASSALLLFRNYSTRGIRCSVSRARMRGRPHLLRQR